MTKQPEPSARAINAATEIYRSVRGYLDRIASGRSRKWIEPWAEMIDRAMAEPAVVPALREALPVRAIAKDAAENIYNDESVIETESIDNEDTLDRWIRIITYAINAGLAQLESAAPPSGGISQCAEVEPETNIQCVFVSGHSGSHRYPSKAEGDISNEIRLRRQLDVTAQELAANAERYERLVTAVRLLPADWHERAVDIRKAFEAHGGVSVDGMSKVSWATEYQALEYCAEQIDALLPPITSEREGV